MKILWKPKKWQKIADVVVKQVSGEIISANIARFLHNKNYKVLVSLVSPYRKLREELRGQDIYQVYCHTTEIRGREEYFVENYEPPIENFIDMDTTNKSVKECIDEILDVCR